MSYPTLEQYNEALQFPQHSLIDPGLRKGSVATTGLGLPLALCGGFALTYTITSGGKKYAVRCFHKQSNALEGRYGAVSSRLKYLKSNYFLDFEFQSNGVKINGQSFPIVKMEWATGNTLGEFLEKQHRNKIEIQQLKNSMRKLAAYLESQNIAHGDIQPDNVMVSNGGQVIQLIDYDGMYVDDLKSFGSSELGLRNFQHPLRSASSWNSSLDRFSFIVFNLSLRVLEEHPELWNKTQSGANSVLFKANDFAEPSQSLIFSDLFRLPQFAEDAKNLAAICKAPFDHIPTLEDFISRRNIPQATITVTSAISTGYISSFPVLDATDYASCFKSVGDRVELIGKIVEIKEGKSKFGKPYIFINFGDWKGEIVKISIWSEGLEAMSQLPDHSWLGKWISVVGLMEPPYQNKRLKYTHLSISVTQANQIHVVTESESKFRLAGVSKAFVSPPTISNKDIIEKIRGNTTVIKPTHHQTQKHQPITPNQAILDRMRATSTSQTSTQQTKQSTVGANTPQQNKKDESGCLILGIIGFSILIFLANNSSTDKSTTNNNQAYLESSKVVSPTENKVTTINVSLRPTQLENSNAQVSATDNQSLTGRASQNEERGDERLPINHSKLVLENKHVTSPKILKAPKKVNKNKRDLRDCLSLGSNEAIAQCVE